MAIDTNITLRRLIYEFNQWATAHEMINKFGYGTWLTHYAKQEENYPIFGLNCTGWNIEQWYVNYQLEVIILGWVFDDRENQQRAESDTTQIFTDLENTIKYSDRWQSFSKLNANIVGTKVEEYGGDKAFGFLATFELKVKKKSGICDISSLLPTYDFETGTIVSPSCESAIITINGSSWGTVASGGTEDIPVKDTDGTAVGSKVGSEWIVPAAGGVAGNTMNGTSLTDIVSGTTKAFTIRYADDSPVTVTTITDNATTFIGEVPNTVNPSVYYNRPYLLQTTSYATYDEAWRKINGGNDYNDAIPDEAYKQQIQPDFVNGRYDYLKYFNKWGHKFRFTGENGGYYDEADGNYYDVNGNLSDLATEFPDIGSSSWWIYDHLTGYRMPNKRGGAINWATALSSTQTYAFGGTVYNWLIWSPEECSQLNNYDTSETGSLIATNRPFFNISLTYFWTGRTVEVSITTAFRYNFAQELGAVDTQGKTNTSQIIYYFTVAETGTIPQP